MEVPPLPRFRRRLIELRYWTTRYTDVMATNAEVSDMLLEDVDRDMAILRDFASTMADGLGGDT